MNINPKYVLINHLKIRMDKMTRDYHEIRTIELLSN